MSMSEEPMTFTMQLYQTLVVSDVFETCGRCYSRAGRVLYEGTLPFIDDGGVKEGGFFLTFVHVQGQALS